MGVKLLLPAIAAGGSLVALPCLSAPFACGGFAQLGGAQLVCSHIDPKAPPQVCTFSWTLATAAGPPSVVGGSFLLVPGAQNVTAYQGAGFTAALAPPVVLCQARRSR